MLLLRKPMSEFAAFARRLTAVLRLEAPPIAISFRDDATAEPAFGGRAARAERGRSHRRGARGLRLLDPRDRADVRDGGRPITRTAASAA